MAFLRPLSADAANWILHASNLVQPPVTLLMLLIGSYMLQVLLHQKCSSLQPY
jgi:hypothetical protein